MRNYLLVIVLLFLLMMAACKPGPIGRTDPTATVGLLAAETEPPTATVMLIPTGTDIPLPTETEAPTASPVPPTLTPTPEPTATSAQAQGLGVDILTLQTLYEDLGMMFTPAVVDGVDALEGMDPAFPEVSVYLIGNPDNLESISLQIELFDTEALYVLLSANSEPIFTARGTASDEIEALIDTINNESVEAINQGASNSQVSLEDLDVLFEISVDEIIYTFNPK